MYNTFIDTNIVYNDSMSILAKDLLSMFILFILRSKSLEFLMCELWFVPKRIINILAKDFVKLSEAVVFPEIIGCKDFQVCELLEDRQSLEIQNGNQLKKTRLCLLL